MNATPHTPSFADVVRYCVDHRIGLIAHLPLPMVWAVDADGSWHYQRAATTASVPVAVCGAPAATIVKANLVEVAANEPYCDRCALRSPSDAALYPDAVAWLAADSAFADARALLRARALAAVQVTELADVADLVACVARSGDAYAYTADAEEIGSLRDYAEDTVTDWRARQPRSRPGRLVAVDGTDLLLLNSSQPHVSAMVRWGIGSPFAERQFLQVPDRDVRLWGPRIAPLVNRVHLLDDTDDTETLRLALTLWAGAGDGLLSDPAEAVAVARALRA